MAIFSKKAAEPVEPTTQEASSDQGVASDEKQHNGDNSKEVYSGTDVSDGSSEHNQAGVRRIEAAATVWTKWYLIAAYGIIWLIYFITSVQEVVIRTMNPFVTSSFEKHSLTPVVYIISSVIGGLSKLPLAKLLDTWGRPEGLTLMLGFWVLGLIMMAACTSVEMYCAAQVFSSVGSQGVSYCLTIFIADTSSLINRPLMLAFATSPYIVTTWIGGPMSDAILKGIDFKWGFGIWTIVNPVVVLPLPLLVLFAERKARAAGILPPRSRGKLTLAAVKKYCIDVDLIGIVILAGGMALFLLPFSLYSFQADKWKSPMIICMIIFGGLLIGCFVLYEKYLAPVTFIPFELLADRTVFFGGMMFVFAFSSSAIWGGYFSSMLLVVWDVGITLATYIGNIYRVGSCFAALVLGVFVRMSGRFKWMGALYALPLTLLGVALMIKFRTASEDIGFVIMTQIFVAFAGGPMVVAGEMAMMAPSDHQHIAVVMAVLDLFSSIGSAIGSTISSAVWTGTFRNQLVKFLPEDAPIDAIYASIYTQLSYPAGTPIRDGISRAYSASQRFMLITSVVLVAVAWGCTWMWRDIKLKGLKQVKGNVV